MDTPCPPQPNADVFAELKNHILCCWSIIVQIQGMASIRLPLAPRVARSSMPYSSQDRGSTRFPQFFATLSQKRRSHCWTVEWTSSRLTLTIRQVWLKHSRYGDPSHFKSKYPSGTC
ncbi:hypothetical protein BDV12DRAFT_169732 [Aspergillus spectabilis]